MGGGDAAAAGRRRGGGSAAARRLHGDGAERGLLHFGGEATTLLEGAA